MSSEKFYIKKYSDRLYGLDEDHKSAGFLVIGDERACMIDTMFGKEYSFEDIRKLTDKEIIVINTHGHADHVLGNIHFEKAYIHKADQKIAIKACTTGKLLFPKRIFNGKYAEFENIAEADIILHGHSMEQNDISLIDSLINGAEEIIEGKTENDTVISISGHKVRKHAFKVDANGTFNSDEHFIFYKYKGCRR